MVFLLVGVEIGNETTVAERQRSEVTRSGYNEDDRQAAWSL
jgi:hypothetical protein